MLEGKLLIGGKWISCKSKFESLNPATWEVFGRACLAGKKEVKVMNEEVFGPVAVVSVFDNMDEAVALANRTVYGLGGICVDEESGCCNAHVLSIGMRDGEGFIQIRYQGIC